MEFVDVMLDAERMCAYFEAEQKKKYKRPYTNLCGDCPIMSAIKLHGLNFCPIIYAMRFKMSKSGWEFIEQLIETWAKTGKGWP